MLQAAARHQVSAALIGKQRALAEPGGHGVAPVGAHAAVVDPAGIRVVGTGVHDRDLARLPVGDVDEDLQPILGVDRLRDLRIVQDALHVGGGRGADRDGDVAPHPAGDHGRQGPRELAGETATMIREHLDREEESDQTDRREDAGDEQDAAHTRGSGRDCRPPSRREGRPR